jgi:hypothetical protein
MEKITKCTFRNLNWEQQKRLREEIIVVIEKLDIESVSIEEDL